MSILPEKSHYFRSWESCSPPHLAPPLPLIARTLMQSRKQWLVFFEAVLTTERRFEYVLNIIKFSRISKSLEEDLGL